MTDMVLGAPVPASVELEHLAGRLASCAASAEQVLAGCNAIQLLQWQSPAGHAYRDAVAVQASALRRAVDRLNDARAAVTRLARETPETAFTHPGWP